jgi:hypothetical protein
LKNKGFKEESMTKAGLDAIGTSTSLESNMSHLQKHFHGLMAIRHNGQAVAPGSAQVN